MDINNQDIIDELFHLFELVDLAILNNYNCNNLNHVRYKLVSMSTVDVEND